ncbi:MAG: redoxin domain-containing protein [Planctomycetaceae bacterium]|nr:redoxin domain-containing protein [Planctomycetaceae bacterium]
MNRLSLVSLSVIFCVFIVNADAVKCDFRDTLASLELRDSRGTVRTARELPESGFVVIAFLGTECPLAKLYGPRLQQLAEQFSGKAVFVGVCSNIQDSPKEVTIYADRAGIQFPILMDPKQQLADLLQATRTPEVVVLDQTRRVVYRGRIDDQFGISVARQSPAKEDLKDALVSLVAGGLPEIAETQPVGCLIGRSRRSQPHGPVNYSKHVAPVLNKRCVECHRSGEIAPFPLTSYQETVGWEAMIAEVINEGRMPPWNANPEFGHFRNDSRLSADEKQTLLTWIENGCPEGNPEDLPPTPNFASGWRMPEPDQVIPVRKEPFTVPATGVVDYQYFEVDLNFTEDKYVVAAEARPGNPSVVHHIIAFLKVPGQKDISLGRMLIGYAPGTSPLIFPEGTAMKVPAGSKILFEMHYTPNGTEQTDLSYIGVRFTDADHVKQEVVGLEALNSKFRIPAGDSDYQVRANENISEDVSLLSLTPHMHLRGKSFRYEARYPDGSREVLLDVPEYDFNWQLRYEFAEPKAIPRGTVIECVATFDNSEMNPNNPDPGKVIGWGQQSNDEMMIGFITAVRQSARK